MISLHISFSPFILSFGCKLFREILLFHFKFGGKGERRGEALYCQPHLLPKGGYCSPCLIVIPLRFLSELPLLPLPSDIIFIYLCVFLLISPVRMSALQEQDLYFIHHCISSTWNNMWHDVGAGRQNKDMLDGWVVRHSSQACLALEILNHTPTSVRWGDGGQGNMSQNESQVKTQGMFWGDLYSCLFLKVQPGLMETGAGDTQWQGNVEDLSPIWLRSTLMLKKEIIDMLLIFL